MKKIACITGATSGIGKSCANILAKNGYDVIITGRRNELLTLTKNEIEEKYKVDVLALCFDVRNKKEVVDAFGKLPAKWDKIHLLINNAGLALGLDKIQNGNLDDWENMIDTNIKGLLYVSKEIIPKMIAAGSGHVVNIGSIAGKETYPKGNVYCATKHAVDALSKAMRIDLLPHKIKVTQICPGMVDTEFSTVRFKGNKTKADQTYEGLTPLYAQDIAEAVFFAVSRPPHVNINDMLIMPTAQAAAAIALRE